MTSKKKKIICEECGAEPLVEYEEGSPEYCPICGSEDVHVLKPESKLLNTFEALDDYNDLE